MLTDQDLIYIRQRGGDPETVKQQLIIFQEGFPYLEVDRPATPGDGIWQLSAEAIDHHVKTYDQRKGSHDVKKFVPASGAASRMFKALVAFLNEGSQTNAHHQSQLLDQHPDVQTFFRQLHRFAFYNDLQQVIEKQGGALPNLIEQGDYAQVLRYLLKPIGLGYENLPKGLIKFHAYPDHTRTAFEEQLVEAVAYTGSEGKTALHFTVSPEHEAMFKAHQQNVEDLHAKANETQFRIAYSQQHPNTDTIAVHLNNEPFRDKDGYPLFRPGGHGALLNNLNNIQGDLIFIKNIDNVVPDRLKPDTYRYKKLLGGILLSYQERIFHYLRRLEDETVPQAFLDEVKTFLAKELQVRPPGNLDQWSYEHQHAYCRSKLDRPIRVCGMVPNQGEPGGGPFWVKNYDGSETLQIVEKAQINTADPQQKAQLNKATHFNPVDLVCGTKDFRGKPFDLTQFIDQNSGFISEKSKDGKPLKALEHPGLWNGAMAYWNTIFVEVPIETFNPVKTILDLLRDNHQAQIQQVADQ